MGKPADKLAYQAVKYRQREGWSHRDLLRLSHPRSVDPAMNATFDWITHNSINDATPALITGFRAANAPDISDVEIAKLIMAYGLSWEMLPDSALASTKVWDALLDRGIGMTALMRQLPRLTRLGMLPMLGEGRTDDVVAMLTNQERLLKDRIHPINALVAHMTYLRGESTEGSSTWTPNRKVGDALDASFYLSFGSVEPAGKRMLLAMDVSHSMTGPVPTGKVDKNRRPKFYPFSSREISAAMAMVTMATEPQVEVVGFTGGGYSYTGTFGRRPEEISNPDNLTPLNISPRQRLGDIIRDISDLSFGRTDCSLPMLYALKHKMPVDTFVIYTDNETWSGGVHPHQAMRMYRETMGIDAKLIVAAMSSTEFSIADPNDSGMLDVVGFDTNVPSLISQFSKGL
jgi:60 kDa SS-A/Ro ribonucleoprotein